MLLRKRATELTYKILSNLQIKDYAAHEGELHAILVQALSSMYKKARQDERDGKVYSELINDTIFVFE